MKKSLIALSVLAATSAFAGGITPANPVSVDGNRVGDLLFAPVYIVDGDFATELRVVNTSTTISTVAKVQFSESIASSEVLDFLIYLSPGDVWVGTASIEDGRIVMRSSDDSILQLTGNSFATAAAPAVYPFSNQNAKYGYVTIVESAAFPVPANVACTPSAVGVPILKPLVKAAYDALPAAIDEATGINVNCGSIATNASTRNLLAGEVTLRSRSFGMEAKLPLYAVVNYDNAQKLSTAVLTELGLSSFTTTAQLEGAIWGAEKIIPYNLNNGTHIVSATFPTRKAYRGVATGVYPFNNTGGVSTNFPTLANVGVRDLTEQLNVVAGQNISPLPTNPQLSFAEMGLAVLTRGAQALDARGLLSQVAIPFAEGYVELGINAVAAPTNATAVGTATVSAGSPGIVTSLSQSLNSGVSQWAWRYAPQKYDSSN